MDNRFDSLENMKVNDLLHGFVLKEKEYAKSKDGYLYSFEHEKTGTELLYFDRADDNKTFSICFKTLPENNTGVFHILEHSVLNGSKKYPVKEPFVSMLQSSMQTFLNAMTFGDKTLYPVSSRNEKDFFNLMSVYLDAVFNPMIYEKPEIFMQEGWHYEFEEDEIYYNGVVYNEMKGVYSDVDSLMDESINEMLYPDNSYGYSSGGNPKYITDLTYEQFVETHKRFYHPTNAKIILDGQMNLCEVLRYINNEYLSKYEYKDADFDFKYQTNKTSENTIYYGVSEGEEPLSHMSISKILCNHDEVLKIYGAKVLEDYLTATNESPLKRAVLEKGLAQDVNLMVADGVLQPSVSLVLHNVREDDFDEIKQYIADTARNLISEGLDKKALLSSIERLDFNSKEIKEPYGVEIVTKILEGWLYGDNPLTHVETDGIFEKLRQSVKEGFFEDLLNEMLGNEDDKSYLYVKPSVSKNIEDEQYEASKINETVARWNDEEKNIQLERFNHMQEWQQDMDDEESLASLPHLNLDDIEDWDNITDSNKSVYNGTEILKVLTKTNGISYLNLYFDVSDFELEELRILNVLTSCFGEWETRQYSAGELQTKIKSTLGNLFARIEVLGKPGNPDKSKTYVVVSASMLEKNVAEGLVLIKEVLLNSVLEDVEKIYEILLQNEYFMKQSLIGEGHMFAIRKALSAFSKEGNVKELLEGESFINWLSEFVDGFTNNKDMYKKLFAELLKKAFAKNRLFVGYSGQIQEDNLRDLIEQLPVCELGEDKEFNLPDKEESRIIIPASVGFSAIGNNIYAMKEKHSGAYQVLASLVSFGYLWGEVRVQGGAYGTGMATRMSGDIFCYSYRDPNVDNTKEVYASIAEFLQATLTPDMYIDDIIIGTVNAFEPLMEPEGICNMECIQYLKGISAEDIARVKKEILETKPEDLMKLVDVMIRFADTGKLCVIGGNM